MIAFTTGSERAGINPATTKSNIPQRAGVNTAPTIPGVGEGFTPSCNVYVQ